MDSQSQPEVKTLKNENELKEKLQEPDEKLVVLEFVKTGSAICSYVEKDRDTIANDGDIKEKARFYVLDVNTFKKSAEKYQVEALPAFVVMDKSDKKRLVVGTDDLKKAILEAYNDKIKHDGLKRESASGEAVPADPMKESSKASPDNGCSIL